VLMNGRVLEGRQRSYLGIWYDCRLGVIGSVRCVYVESFQCVKLWSFAMVLQHLHCIVNGVKGVTVFNKILGKFRYKAVGPKRVFVFLEPYSKAAFGLTHIRFLTVGARDFISSRLYVSAVICCLYISLLRIVLLVRKAILRLARLKMLVTNVVSFPV